MTEIQAYFTGFLAGQVHRWRAAYAAKDPEATLKITNVVSLTNLEGDYEPRFLVEFESGAMLKVSVEDYQPL